MAADETRVDAADVLATAPVGREWDDESPAAILAALREAAGGGPFMVDDDGSLWRKPSQAEFAEHMGDPWPGCYWRPVVGP